MILVLPLLRLNTNGVPPDCIKPCHFSLESARISDDHHKVNSKSALPFRVHVNRQEPRPELSAVLWPNRQ